MRVSLISFFLALAVADAASSFGASRTTAPWGILRGGASSSYASKLDAVKEQVLASTLPSVRTVRISCNQIKSIAWHPIIGLLVLHVVVLVSVAMSYHAM